MKLSLFFTILALVLNAVSAQGQTVPSFTSNPNATFGEAEPNSLTITATGSPAPTFSISATGGGTLPTWLSLNTTTGVLSGNPPNTIPLGTQYAITVTASNTAGQITQNFSLTAGSAIYTIPEGSFPYNLPATGVAGNSVNYFSIPLLSEPVYSGAVSTITASGTTPNTISVGDSSPPFVNTSNGPQLANLATPSAPYFVKFLTGMQAGRILLVTANTSNSLTLDVTDHSTQTVSLTAPDFSVSATSGNVAGDSFEVFAGDTLGMLLGVNTTQSPLILTGGTSTILADVVDIYSPSLSRLVAYYFNTSTGYWEQNGTSANANNTIIYPYSTFEITRRSNEPAVTFSVIGRVSEVNRLIKTTGNSSALYDSTGYPADITLSQLNLGANGASWTEGSSPVVADTLSVWNPTLSRFDSYFETADSTWLKVGGGATDESNFAIPAGTAVIYVKRTPVNGVSSYLETVMPYTLN